MTAQVVEVLEEIAMPPPPRNLIGPWR